MLLFYELSIVRQTADGQTDGQIEGQIDRQVDGQIEGQVDRQVDRQTDREIDRQADRQIDRHIDKYIRKHTYIHTYTGGQTQVFYFYYKRQINIPRCYKCTATESNVSDDECNPQNGLLPSHTISMSTSSK